MYSGRCELYLLKILILNSTVLSTNMYIALSAALDSNCYKQCSHLFCKDDEQMVWHLASKHSNYRKLV